MSILEDVSSDVRTLVQNLGQSVLMVGDESSGWRSGVFLGNDEVVTIARWADDGESVPVVKPDGEQTKGTVKGFDLATGLTLIVCEGLKGESLESAAEKPLVGSMVVTVAYPSPEGHEASLGMVRCVGENSHDGPYYQTDGSGFPGFEGALIADVSGRPIGIMGRTGRRRDDLILPLQTVMDRVNHLREHGSTTTGYLGVRTEAVAPPKGVGGETALLVVGVEEDSPADAAGIMVGDILASADGHPIENHGDLMKILSQTRENGEIGINVIRGGEERPLTVLPGRRRPGHGHRNHHGGRRKPGEGSHHGRRPRRRP